MEDSVFSYKKLNYWLKYSESGAIYLFILFNKEKTSLSSYLAYFSM